MKDIQNQGWRAVVCVCGVVVVVVAVVVVVVGGVIGPLNQPVRIHNTPHLSLWKVNIIHTA